MKPGDYIRFLDAEGGGQVLAEEGERVWVCDDLGLEYWAFASNCVVVDSDLDSMLAGTRPKRKKMPDGKMEGAFSPGGHCSPGGSTAGAVRRECRGSANGSTSGSVGRSTRGSAGHSTATAGQSLAAMGQEGWVELDLHAESLPTKLNSVPLSDYLPLQLDHAVLALRKYARRKGLHIVFIHGVGDGSLRTALRLYVQEHYPAFECMDAPFYKYGYMGATLVVVR